MASSSSFPSSSSSSSSPHSSLSGIKSSSSPPPPPQIVILPLAIPNQPSSLEAKLLLNAISNDWKCAVCGRVPLGPVTPQCCGTPCCITCYEAKKSSICSFCGSNPAGSAIISPYLSLKISGEDTRCPWNERGCSETTAIGKDGSKILLHIQQCPFGSDICPGCNETILRSELVEHRGPSPTKDYCRSKPIFCEACNIKVKPQDQASHDASESHKSASLKRMGKLLQQVNELEARMNDINDKFARLSNKFEADQKQYQLSIRQSEERFNNMTVGYGHKMNELQAAYLSRFVEIEITGWSQIHCRSDQQCVAIYSSTMPLLAWHHAWWLKIEKGLDGRVGFFLCCGSDDGTTSADNNKPGSGIISNSTSSSSNSISINSDTSRWPITVDYQLMVRKRGTDDAVCCSVVFRTEYGRERAWGLSRFATMDILEREGAYNKTEDKITFGCVIFPVRGLRWGQPPGTIRRARPPAKTSIHPSPPSSSSSPPPPPPPPPQPVVVVNENKLEEKQSPTNPPPPPLPPSSNTPPSTTNSIQPSGVYGYCSMCERPVPVRVARRCSKCHSEKIAEVKDDTWTDLNIQYNGCVHTDPTSKCDHKQWEFVGTCLVHPEKSPDKHCPLLPGVQYNSSGMECLGCHRAEPVILRFGCGHFVCIPHCWRNYARTKLDNRELLFDVPRLGADATLACPAGCRSYVKSHNLFKSLGKARYEQYQTLGMEHLVGRMLTPESTDGRLPLQIIIPEKASSKRCPHCSAEHRRYNNLNCHMRCPCGYEWCWTCNKQWSSDCQTNHLIS